MREQTATNARAHRLHHYRWHVGDRVVHPTLGAGVITDTRWEGNDTKVTVRFDYPPGEKTLSLRQTLLTREGAGEAATT